MPTLPLTATVTDSTGASATGTVSVTVLTAVAPSVVPDLAVASVTPTSATLIFTEVNDGTGAPASYDLRSAAGTLAWGTATEAPIVLGTTIGAKRTLTIVGLAAATAYQFQLVAFRGTLNVNAVFGAFSNIATGTTAGVVVPPSGTWPNEPAGLATISDYNLVPFSPVATQGEAPLTGGWNSIWNGRGLLTQSTDATEPMSPPTVLRCAYPIGYTGGEGPGALFHALPSVRRFFCGFTIKVLSPWQGHNTSVNKIGYMFVNGGSCPLVFYGSAPSGPYQLRAFPFQLAPGGIGPDQWWVPNVDSTPFTVGVWHTIEWLMDTTVGRLFWALDGKVQANYTGVPMPATGFVEYKLDPVWGGANDTKRQNDAILFGHIRLAGA